MIVQNLKEGSKARQAIGWIGVGITVVLTGVWSFWGIIENFHEGWYAQSLWENIGMLFLQYLLFTFIFSGLGCLSLRFPKIGLVAHIALGVFTVLFFSGSSFQVTYLLIAIPLILLGLLYLFGRPKPRKLAYLLIICVPFLIIAVFGGINYARVSKRIDDGDYGLRIIEGNGITLAAAPRGPGWPRGGVTWEEAMYICAHLSEDGTELMESEQNIWRLPSVDEAVRLMSLHGENSGGVWNEKKKEAQYELTPDKESPLWDVYSQIIYYWTAVEAPNDKAYIIVYDGGVFERKKDSSYGYLGFRAVKDIE